ncbi:hypothetical protein UA08_08294 [Talaromyces atroroseus]|uniref:Aromatic prenyltransferase n=1 Tax=Talaromyces atroroseus TaxID=1441469 RepID=A0A225AM62_TALAT|nr:hypothetical protein UA08_08294 [Talaromyces atroroseus]OKL56659.1 hypothetical protein UA08_08294 [Talaromyces atroroseus]
MWNFLVRTFGKAWIPKNAAETDTQQRHIRAYTADPSLWQTEIGTILLDMLEMAGYPIHSTKIHTEFFHKSVAPSLGPHPRGTGEPAVWKSFMTDDHTPIELSWCWSSSQQTPVVRYSVEPIGRLAGESVDPINTAASVRLLGEALPLAPEIDLYLHRHFQQHTMSKKLPEDISAPDMPLSQSFMAFDLLEETVVVKQYYLPGWTALREAKSKFDIIKGAIQKLPFLADSLPSSFDVFVGFLESFPPESRPTVEILAIDLLDPLKSRLKVYVRCRDTTLKSVYEMLSLGGRAPKTPEEEKALRELWYSVFGLDENKLEDSQPLPKNDHLTGGILYYFEFKTGLDVPRTKIYMPVRHYARDDDQIARGLSQYLDRRGKNLTTGSYYESVQRICKHRSLASGLGFHTYISWTSENNAWNVTAYFNPQIYHPGRSVGRKE